MHTNTQSESSLRFSSDLFVTFLYAAAVHLILAHFAASPHQTGQPVQMLVRPSLLVLLLIIFLFSDWIGRVRLPWLLPPEDQVGVSKQLLKTALEVAGLFFLVLAWLTIIEVITTGHSAAEAAQAFWSLEAWRAVWSGKLSPYKAFAFFLILTFFWNLLMLRVMSEISWWDLVGMAIRGDALDSPEGRHYAKRFWQFRDELETRVEAQLEPRIQQAGRNFGLATATFYADACVRMFAQIVAIHIAWTNLIAGIIIFFGDAFFGRRSVYAELKQINWPTLAVNGWEWFSWTNSHTTLVVTWVLHPLFVLALAILFFYFMCLQWQEKKLWLIPLITLVLLVSTILFRLVSPAFFRAEFILILILGIPIMIFYMAAKLDEVKDRAKKGRRLKYGGITSAFLLLLLYLIVEPKMLVCIVAFQQVAINGFLQYAASAPRAPLSPNALPAVSQEASSNV